MSAINGDKARFNRRRRQNIGRRARHRVMFGALLKQAGPTIPRSNSKSKEKSA
jgi:hypothetical protein